MFFWFRKWNKFKNRSIFDIFKEYEVNAYKSVPVFMGHVVLHTPRHQLHTYGRRAFAVAGPSAWNSLPDSVHNPNSTEAAFRRLLKTFLFARYLRTQRIRWEGWEGDWLHWHLSLRFTSNVDEWCLYAFYVWRVNRTTKTEQLCAPYFRIEWYAWVIFEDSCRLGVTQSWTWIGSIDGWDWIGLDGATVTRFSNLCSTVDAVSFQLWFMNF